MAEALICNRDEVFSFYEHLLDLIETTRLSEKFPEWCELEREFVALFGENIFSECYDHFRDLTEMVSSESTVDLHKLNAMLEEALANETLESLNRWLDEKLDKNV